MKIEIHVAAKTTFGPPKWFEEFLAKEKLDSLNHNTGVDHPRHYKNIALLHPYFAIGKDLLKLLNACESQGLTVDIGGTSNYYPSATFRIAVYHPKDEEQFREYFGKQQTFEVNVPDDYVGEKL
jgi:hypothetical protein